MSPSFILCEDDLRDRLMAHERKVIEMMQSAAEGPEKVQYTSGDVLKSREAFMSFLFKEEYQ